MIFTIYKLTNYKLRIIKFVVNRI